MSFKWVVPAVLVSCGVVISTVIAQLAIPAVSPPVFQEIDAVESPPAPTPIPAALAADPPSAVNSTLAPEPPLAPTPAPTARTLAPASPTVIRGLSVIGGRSKPPAGEPEMVVLRLRNTDAPTVSEMLRNLLANDELEAVHPTVDSRSNSLILRGPKDDVDRVSKLVVQLDSESEAKVGALPPKPVPSATRVRSSSSPNAAWQAANNPYVSPPRIPTAADVKLIQEYTSLESQSLEAAKEYRKGMESHPQRTDSLSLARREQIKNLVEKSFDVRQELQNQELKQLKERMAKVEQSLSKRAENRSEIIGKRIKELLEEDRDLEWNASTPPALPPGYSAGYTAPQPAMIPRTVTGPDGNTVTVYEVDPRTTQLGPIIPNYSGNPTVTNSPAVVPPQYGPPIVLPIPLAAPGTLTTKYDEKWTAHPAAAGPFAQPVGGEQRRALGSANELVLRKEAEVAGWKKKLGEAGLQENAEYQTVLRELQAAKRQLDNAKRESEALLTLLQLDLEAAAAELNSVAEDYDRKIQLQKATRSSITDDELRRARGAKEQAEIRVNRAKVLFQLHQDAVRSEQAAAGTTEPATSAPEKAAPSGASRR